VKHKTPHPFLWRPGQGPDAAALSRLYAHFPRPRAPMRGAYVMSGERTEFDTEDDPRGALFDIASATCSFGWDREWIDWFHYLLADETLFAMRAGVLERPLIEALATAFFAIYPEGVTREPYRGFERDALETLGRAIVSAECWSEGRIRRGEILRREKPPWGTWGWREPSGDLSASMFFCLKYLTPEEIGPWLTSTLAIEDRYWRAQLMAFCVAAHPLLTGDVLQPAGLAEAQPPLEWENSHILKGVYYAAFDKAPAPFLAQANCTAARGALASFFNEDIYLDWLCAIAEDEELEAEMTSLPEQFRLLYPCSLQG